MLVLGIDIGKEELVACLQQAAPGSAPEKVGPLQTITNTPQGLAKLTRWLSCQSTPHCDLHQVHVVMEATNVYWEACAHHFHGLGCTISV